MLRVDAVPVSLALAQAAYESGYATSRFATEGNALFGQWRWGHGLVPHEQRGDKGDYRIAVFVTPLESAAAYMLNPNTHPSYRRFRMAREAQRHAMGDETAAVLTGLALAATLKLYAEEGEVYVETLQGIICDNGLCRLDGAQLSAGPVIKLFPLDR
jgi:Bax protein